MPLYEFKFDEFDKITDVFSKYLKVLPGYETEQETVRFQKTMTVLFQD